MARVKLLRRVLTLEAAGLVGYGLVTGLTPRWLLEGVFDQPPLDEYVWVRISGVQAIGAAMLMLIVARRIEDLWWSSWTFVIVAAGIVILASVSALLGLPDGVSPSFWWILAVGATVYALALITALAKAGTERSPN